MLSLALSRALARSLARSLCKKVLEADAAAPPGRTAFMWSLQTLLSPEHRLLRDELDATRRLLSRIAAVRFTAVEFAARGQVGVRSAPPAERALVSRYSSDEMKRLEGQGRPAEETRSMPQTG